MEVKLLGQQIPQVKLSRMQSLVCPHIQDTASSHLHLQRALCVGRAQRQHCPGSLKPFHVASKIIKPGERWYMLFSFFNLTNAYTTLMQVNGNCIYFSRMLTFSMYLTPYAS